MKNRIEFGIAVSYGIERLNREVSHWMRGLQYPDSHPEIPFIATRGYDSVVWNRLYSRDVSGLDEYQIDQVRAPLHLANSYIFHVYIE